MKRTTDISRATADQHDRAAEWCNEHTTCATDAEYQRAFDACLADIMAIDAEQDRGGRKASFAAGWVAQ